MKTHHNLLFFTIASALLLSSLISTILLAGQAENIFEQEKMDRPCPGKRADVFSIHDLDQSGSLNQEEYRHFQEQMENRRKTTGRPMRRHSPPLHFEDVDQNNDGVITEDELIFALKNRLRKHRRYRQRGHW